MYAVPAWSVHPLTRSLVGTKMNNTIQNNNNNKKQTAKGQQGKPMLADCKQSTVQPSGDSLTKSSEVALDFKPSTSKAALALAGNIPATAPALDTVEKTVVPAKMLQVGSSNQKSGPTTVAPPATTAEPNAPIRKEPSRRAFVQRRAAMRIIDRLGSKSADALNIDELSKLSWAKAQLAELDSSNTPPSADAANQGASAGPKRQRSEEELLQQQNTQPKTKRPKQEARVIRRPYSEVARNPLVRAIIDRSVDDGAISQEKWLKIRQGMLGVYWKILKENPGPSPQNDDAGWYQGHVKLLACTNDRSALLLKLAIASLGELWPGAKLDVIPVNEIPRRPRSVTVIPAEPHEPEEILAYIQSGNPDLPTHNWKVVKVSAPEGAHRKVVVVLNKESLAPLRERQSKIYYGFDSIKLRIYRGDDKLDPETSGVKLEAPQDMDCKIKLDDPASSEDKMETQSHSSMVGDLFCALGDVEDEDVLLESDPEDIDVTVIYDPDHGEGDPSEPSPL
ncbi:uncharacterized protein LOC135962813 [Calliphora vicina]|uniref:uncharacterized protein LOC135948968 n=3 Tax=Calliphora vicina TaxID=7373 RepID=UPI00325C1224